MNPHMSNPFAFARYLVAYVIPAWTWPCIALASVLAVSWVGLH